MDKFDGLMDDGKEEEKRGEERMKEREERGVFKKRDLV